MINPNFYKNPNNMATKFLGGGIKHYLTKDKVTVLETYPYVMDFGEDMYTLARKIFGETNQHLWTIIAEINPIRRPDDWAAGDTVNLPLLIVQENESPRRGLSNELSLTSTLL